MPDTDIAAAARRVAADIRSGAIRPDLPITGASGRDVIVLRPLIEAMARGRGDLTRSVAAAFGAEMYGDGRPWGSFDKREQDALMRGARAAIALADAERAADVA